MMTSQDENQLKIAKRLCDKDIELPLSNCFNSKDRKCFCEKSDKCEIEKLSDGQLNYIVQDIAKHTFLEACPGSGKTEVVGIKTAYEIANWKNENSGIAILTFTRNAAKEIQNRTQKYTVHKTAFPNFIGTIDSWLHSFIFLHPFGYLYTQYSGTEGDKSIRIIDNTNKADFLKIYKTKYSYERVHIQANNFYYNLEDERYIFQTTSFAQTHSLNKQTFEEWQKNDFWDTKYKFWKSGFSTYQDAEFIVLKLLLDNDSILNILSNRFKQIVIDECQDLSYTQLAILKLLLNKGTTLHFVGDINQSIYEFRKVDPQNTLNFIENNKFRTRKLSKNYRSNQGIVDLCSRIIESKNQIEGNTDNNVDNPFIVWTYKDDKELSSLPNKFSEFVNNSEHKGKVLLNKAVVLARSKSILSKINPSFSDKLKKQHYLAIALHQWNKENKTKADIEIALELIGKFLSQTAYQNIYCNHQKYFVPENIDYIEWRYFLNAFMNNLLNSKWPFDDLTESNWLKKIKPILNQNWNLLPDPKNDFSSRAISGSTNDKISACIDIVGKSNDLKLTTIHKVKGQTFDAVLLVSAKTKKAEGGHWSQWLTGANKEYKRLGYVASSRPKYLLIWAIPEKDKDEFEAFSGLNIM